MARFFSNLRHSALKARRFLLENHLQPFPLGKSLSRYSSHKFQRDLGAGMAVSLLAIPQGMAYALLAGLPVVYGITCSAVAAMVAPIFANSRHTVLGPTNATALMVFGATAGSGMLPLMILLAALMLIIGAYLRFADLVQFISRSVVVGYVTGAGLLIMATQLRETLGISSGGGGRSFLALGYDVLTRLSAMQWPVVALSAFTLGAYIIVRKWAPRWPAFIVVLVAASVLLAVLDWVAHGVVGNVSRLDAFKISDLLPPMPDWRTVGNIDDLGMLFGPALALAFLSALETSVMAKTLASRSGDRTDPNQDMLSAGMANLSCAFFSGMPASGSLTRSALNFSSGAMTPMASMFSGVACLGGALCLGNAVRFIPKCSLAVLVICIAATLINRRNLQICLRATRSDASTVLVTIAATLLLPLHVAIFVGVAVSVALYLRKASQPELVEYEFSQSGDLTAREGSSPRQNPSISIVHVEGELFFGAAELFRTQIQRTVVDPNLRVIILRMKNARHLDATSVMALEELITFLRSKDRHLLISGAMKEVYRVLKNSGLIDVLGRENIFLGSPMNPNLSTRNALKRATELLGGQKAEVRIYYDPQHGRAGE